MRATRIKLDDSISQLATAIAKNPRSVDRKLAQAGEDLLAVFVDERLRMNPEMIAEAKRLAILDAIDDIAAGASILSKGAIGTKLEEGELLPFIQMNSDSNPIHTIFSVRLKRTGDFQAWRRGNDIEMPEAQTNACIYYLVTLLAAT